MADINSYVPPQWQGFQFPQFNQPGFPYANQPAQTAASVAQGNGPFTNASQYGRLNVGAAPSPQWPALFQGMQGQQGVQSQPAAPQQSAPQQLGGLGGAGGLPPPGYPGLSPAANAATTAWGQARGQDVTGSLAAQAQFQQAQAASRQTPGSAVADPNFNGQVIDVPWSQIGNFRLPTNLGNGPVSLRFTTPSTIGDTAGMQFSQGQGQQEAFRLASLATQPGVFGTGPGAQGNNVLRSLLSASPNFRFNVGGQSNAGTQALNPNTTYYMNLANRNSYGGPDMFGQNYGTNFDFTNG